MLGFSGELHGVLPGWNLIHIKDSKWSEKTGTGRFEFISAFLWAQKLESLTGFGPFCWSWSMLHLGLHLDIRKKNQGGTDTVKILNLGITQFWRSSLAMAPSSSSGVWPKVWVKPSVPGSQRPLSVSSGFGGGWLWLQKKQESTTDDSDLIVFLYKKLYIRDLFLKQVSRSDRLISGGSFEKRVLLQVTSQVKPLRQSPWCWGKWPNQQCKKRHKKWKADFCCGMEWKNTLSWKAEIWRIYWEMYGHIIWKGQVGAGVLCPF